MLGLNHPGTYTLNADGSGFVFLMAKSVNTLAAFGTHTATEQGLLLKHFRVSHTGSRQNLVGGSVK